MVTFCYLHKDLDLPLYTYYLYLICTYIYIVCLPVSTYVYIQDPAEVTPVSERECLARDRQQFEHFT